MIGAEPATSAVCCGAGAGGAALAVSVVADGLNGGRAAACLITLGFVSADFAATAFGAGLLSTGLEVTAAALAAIAPLELILRRLEIRLAFSGALTAATRGVVEPTEVGSGAAAVAISSALCARGGLT